MMIFTEMWIQIWYVTSIADPEDFIPYPDFFHPGIPDSGSWIWDFVSRIPDP
jgi:hypothetical protein